MASARRPGTVRGARAVAAGSLALLLAGGLPSLAGAEDTIAFTITDARVTESSGLARDEAAQGYWTVNDSGSAGVVYQLGPEGRTRGTLNYRAQPRDVEALARQGDRLYVADIGDNTGVRDSVSVYYFLNPRASGLTVMYNSYDFRYPDGPHDAETLLVDGTGRLYLVTKGVEGGIYAAPENPSRSGVNVLQRVGAAPGLVTDGVFLPGDTQIALLTYGSVVVLDATSYAQVASAPIPAQAQAESLAVNLAGDGLLVGSEGRNSKVFAIPVPGAAGNGSPAAPGSPVASGSPSGSATPDAGDDDPDLEDLPPGPSRQGTFLALALAGLVALVAGVVVAAVRKP